MTPNNKVSFVDLPQIKPEIQKALAQMGITHPTEIQEKAIEKLIVDASVDFHGQAQTGTGKTLAFGIPLLQKIDPNSKAVQALIVAPTRELVVQICESLRKASLYMRGVTIQPIYGGVSLFEQMRVLKKGVHIVVGTPGRLNDHLQRGSLSLKTASIVVLDEADIMLDMGFKDEVEEILAHTPAQRQLWLFSATTKDGVSSIIKSMRSPVTVRIAPSAASTPKTLQYYCIAPRTARFEALCAFIEQAEEFYGIVFCRTKASTQEIADRLVRRGLDAKALHGDMAQGARNRVIEEFKRRGASILVATDVAARGIDVSDLTHVINYSLPDDPESYVHRVGRTGRAGKEGMAITMIGHQEIGEIKRLARRFNMTITALEVPCSDTMLQKRLDSALAYTGATKSAVAQNPQVEALQKHLAGRSAEELVSITTRLLVEKFLTLHVNHPSEEGDVSDARDGGRGGDADRGFAPRRSGGGRSGGGRFGGRGRSGGGSGGFRREGGSSSSNAGGSFKPRRKF